MAWRRSGVRIPIAPPAQRVISNAGFQDQETRFQDQETSVAMTGLHGATEPDTSGLLACEYDRNRPPPVSVAPMIWHIVPDGCAAHIKGTITCRARRVTGLGRRPLSSECLPAAVGRGECGCECGGVPQPQPR